VRSSALGLPATPERKTIHQLQGTLTALNLSNNGKVWQRRYFSDTGGVWKSGSSTTASGLVFIAVGNVFYAYDAKTGAAVVVHRRKVVVNTPPVIYVPVARVRRVERRSRHRRRSSFRPGPIVPSACDAWPDSRRLALLG
jgi:hypothetical protein